MTLQLSLGIVRQSDLVKYQIQALLIQQLKAILTINFELVVSKIILLTRCLLTNLF